MSSAGFAWALGQSTARRGTLATALTRPLVLKRETRRHVAALLWSVTFTYVHSLLQSTIIILMKMQYYNRWANHEQSAKLSADMYAKTEKKMEEMQITSNLSWIEVQFAKKAADELFKCRMTLKWTYAMAYYLQKDNEKEIFEANQR